MTTFHTNSSENGAAVCNKTETLTSPSGLFAEESSDTSTHGVCYFGFFPQVGGGHTCAPSGAVSGRSLASDTRCRAVSLFCLEVWRRRTHRDDENPSGKKNNRRRADGPVTGLQTFGHILFVSKNAWSKKCIVCGVLCK